MSGTMEKLKLCIVCINNLSGLYILWIILQFISAHLYVHYFANMSVYGFIMSPILVAAPHCKALRWGIYIGAQTIENMWIVLGTWICSKIMIITTSKK
jgi:hypothetical protein